MIFLNIVDIFYIKVAMSNCQLNNLKFIAVWTTETFVIHAKIRREIL